MINKVDCQGGYWEPMLKNKSDDSGFANILQAEQAKNMTAKEYLTTLKPDELTVLQRASHLAEPIDISKLSEEGARNLLAEGDKTKYVDLNNDGITEIGAGKSFIFPPPNAPQAVKVAWEKATANMTFQEKMLAEAPFLVEQFVTNIHQLTDGSYQVVEPGELGYLNPFAGDSKDYSILIDRIINKLTDQIRIETNPEFKKHRELQLGVLQDFLMNIQTNTQNNYLN